MPTMVIEIPETVLAQYEIRLHQIQQLDMSGEFCQYCCRDGQYVDVQFYGHTLAGFPFGEPESEEVFGTCCVDCLEDSLQSLNVDPHLTVTVEYER